MPNFNPAPILVSAIDSFTYHNLGGNPAGVLIVPGKTLTPCQMLAIAKEVGFSETAFISILSSEKEGILTTDIKYFTPESEVPLCGHATIAAFYHLAKEGYFLKNTAMANTGAGSIEITRSPLDAPINETIFSMTQGTPVFTSFTETYLTALYDAFSPTLQDSLHQDLPIIIGSTGLRDIIVPIKSREALNHINIVPQKLSKLSSHLQVTGVHAFCMDGHEVYARNFAPLYGIDEESATGTSNGVLISYLHHYLYPEYNEITRHIKQGETMGALSSIVARSQKSERGYTVLIGGSCSERAEKLTLSATYFRT